VPLLRISVPAPDLVSRVFAAHVTGMAMSSTSVGPSTRMLPCTLLRLTLPVVPAPPLIVEVPPPVLRMPPAPEFVAPLMVSEAFCCIVRLLVPTIFRLPLRVPLASVVAGWAVIEPVICWLVRPPGVANEVPPALVAVLASVP